MQAHKAKNKTPLESDKFFDEPDFMIYEIGGERIACTAKEAAAIYAEFEKMISNLYAIGNLCLCLSDLEHVVPDMKESGVIRFCYTRRRKYTGTYPYTYPPLYDVPYVSFTDYNWEDFTYDEVMLDGYEIVLAEDGAYKSPRSVKSGNVRHIQMQFHKGAYSHTVFNEAVMEILRIKERFPHVFDKWPEPQYNFV